MINQIIKDNVKIDEKAPIENEIKNQIDKENLQDSFSQLLSLQLLIQKHSGLKELCKIKINFYYF